MRGTLPILAGRHGESHVGKTKTERTNPIISFVFNKSSPESQSEANDAAPISQTGVCRYPELQHFLDNRPMRSKTIGSALAPQAPAIGKTLRLVAAYPASVVLMLMPALLAGQDRPPGLVSYYGKTPVLDGVLSPGEWNDATEFRGAKDWWPAFHPVTDDSDLSMEGYVKHDDKFIYFAADVTDDLLYGIDTDRYLPASNPKAHELTREGFPWLGDEMEILLNATNTPPRGEVEGNGWSWQMVCNLTKSRAGGCPLGAGSGRGRAWRLGCGSGDSAHICETN